MGRSFVVYTRGKNVRRLITASIRERFSSSRVARAVVLLALTAGAAASTYYVYTQFIHPSNNEKDEYGEPDITWLKKYIAKEKLTDKDHSFAFVNLNHISSSLKAGKCGVTKRTAAYFSAYAYLHRHTIS